MQNDPIHPSHKKAKPLVYGSVCSGIEAATAAWHPLGWQPAFFSEIAPFPRAVLQHHYATVPLHGDFTTIQEHDYAAIDLLVGGTPCQSFSVAGLRKGLADERGNLTLEFVRLAERLRPRWLVWENVPGVLSQDRGRAFGSFLGGLAELGYGFAYRVLDAQHFGVPQRRRRVFVVGHLGDWRPAAAVLFESESLRRDLTPRREAGERPAPTISARTQGGGGLGTDFDLDGGLIHSPVAPCLEASFARLQGASGQDLNHGHGHLIAFGGNNQAGPIDVATAVNAHGGPHGRLDFESETFVVPLQEVGQRTGISTTDPRAGIGDAGDPMFTLQATAQHAVAFAQNTRDELRYIGGDGQVVGALAAEPGMKQQSYIQQAMAVRRLTPRECERLQGFRDDFTLVPYRGKPAADGPRYKALGNSMAVPCMRWIGDRIQSVNVLQAEVA